METKHLWLVAGHSGGHLLPALELGRRWFEKNSEGSVTLFTTKKELDTSIAYNHRLVTSFVFLPSCRLPGKKFWKYPLLFGGLLYVFIVALYQGFRFRPEKVISTGSLISFPVVLAAWVLRIPIDLYELNVIPGRAVRMLTRFAQSIYVPFKQTQEWFKRYQPAVTTKCKTASYPLRFFQNAKERYSRDVLLKRFHFSKERKTLFILGGSQGSLFLNLLVKQLVERSKELKNRIQVIHQTGMNTEVDWHSFYAKHTIPAITFSYSHDIVPYYALADLVISRGGAGSLFELAHFCKKSIIIPLKLLAEGHQVANAQAMIEEHPELFTVLDQGEVKNDHAIFAAQVDAVLNESVSKQR